MPYSFPGIVQQRVHSAQITPDELVRNVVERNVSVVSDTELFSLDRTLQWPEGFAAAARDVAADNVSAMVYYEQLAVRRHLGYDCKQSPLSAAGSVVWAAPAEALIPRIASWSGTVLVDVRAFGSFERELAKLAESWRNERGQEQMGKTGISELALSEVDAVAVDPLPGIQSLAQARGLVEQIQAVRGLGPGEDASGAALTVLAAVIQLGEDSGDSSNGLDLMRQGINESILRGLVEKTGMGEKYARLANCEDLFAGLYRARDLAVNVVLRPAGGVKVWEMPVVKSACDLTGFLLFYDSAVCPELPIVVDDALGRVGEPTLVVSARAAFPGFGDGGDRGGCLAVVVVKPGELKDDWVSEECGYATVSEFNRMSGQAVYTERGRSQVVQIPSDYQPVRSF